MEDDVQSQPELETGAVETPEETIVEEDSGSEAAQTQSEANDKGDLRIPLKEERERRQRLEMALSDPNFIIEQAKRLGLTAEEAAAEAQAQANLTPGEVRQQIRVEKALDKHPELRTNHKLQLMASALIQGGMDPVEAADEVMGLMSKGAEQGRMEGVKQAKTEISEKERAATVNGQVRTDTESQRLDDLRKRMKSYDRRTQEDATVEWLKAKNEKNGVI